MKKTLLALLLLASGTTSLQAMNCFKSLIGCITSNAYNILEEFDQSPKEKLFEAVEKKNTTAIKVLLKNNNIDINITNDNGQSLLYLAVIYNNINMVELLLEQEGIDVNLPDNLYKTPLYVAAHWGYTEIVKLLVENGADWSIKNKWGNIALKTASQQDQLCNKISKKNELKKIQNYLKTIASLARGELGMDKFTGDITLITNPKALLWCMIYSAKKSNVAINPYTYYKTMQEKNKLVVLENMMHSSGLLEKSEDISYPNFIKACKETANKPNNKLNELISQFNQLEMGECKSYCDFKIKFNK